MTEELEMEGDVWMIVLYLINPGDVDEAIHNFEVESSAHALEVADEQLRGVEDLWGDERRSVGTPDGISADRCPNHDTQQCDGEVDQQFASSRKLSFLPSC